MTNCRLLFVCFGMDMEDISDFLVMFMRRYHTLTHIYQRQLKIQKALDSIKELDDVCGSVNCEYTRIRWKSSAIDVNSIESETATELHAINKWHP